MLKETYFHYKYHMPSKSKLSKNKAKILKSNLKTRYTSPAKTIKPIFEVQAQKNFVLPSLSIIVDHNTSTININKVPTQRSGRKHNDSKSKNSCSFYILEFLVSESNCINLVKEFWNSQYGVKRGNKAKILFCWNVLADLIRKCNSTQSLTNMCNVTANYVERNNIIHLSPKSIMFHWK